MLCALLLASLTLLVQAIHALPAHADEHQVVARRPNHHKSSSPPATLDSVFKLLESPQVSEFNSESEFPKKTNIAFFNTHQTGSTTLASILYRFAARHNSSVFVGQDFEQAPSHLIKPVNFEHFKHNRSLVGNEHAYNLVFSHLSDQFLNVPLPGSVTEVRELFDYLIDDPYVVTMLNAPIDTSLSWMFAHYPDEARADLAGTIDKHLPFSPSCYDFGITSTAEGMQMREAFESSFNLIVLKEFFDECMVMLRRHMNWDLEDILYLDVPDDIDAL
jgi:hypothetical protein